MVIACFSNYERDNCNGKSVMIYLDANKEIHLYYLKGNCLVYQG